MGAFKCISCQSEIDPSYKACPYCGTAVTDFLRQHHETPVDGKYRILSSLGAGGMGEVYKVLHIHLNTVRVIKLMRSKIANDAGAHERFVREARLATRINHPNVATLNDFSTLPDGSRYMVWEYIEGKNLHELIREQGPLSPRHAAAIACEALLGLDAIHRAGIVHRDISPENIMVSVDEHGEEHVKIIDLGIAKDWDDEVYKTVTGMFVGKWKYCSPEHLGILESGGRIDARADIYSFGIVLYEMITGVAPFQADTPHGFLMKHASEVPAALVEVNPSVRVSPELEAVIFRALEKDRNRRFATAREFAQALAPLITGLDDDEPASRRRPAARTTTVAAPARDEVHHPTREIPLPTSLDTLPATPGMERTVVPGSTIVGTDPESAAEAEAPAPPVETVEVPEPEPEPAAADIAVEGPEVVPAPAFERRTLDVVGPVVTGDSASSKSRLPWIGIGAVAALAILAAFLLLRRPRSDEAAVVDAASAVPAVPGRPGAAAASARLELTAFPWAEVAEIRNVKSGEALPLSPGLVTPAAVDLEPGTWEIRFRNGSFAEPIVRRVQVAAGQTRGVRAEFVDPSDAPMPSFRGAAR